MRIISILLALLLSSSSVFAETWICSWSDDDEIFNDTYVRTVNGFNESRDGDALDFTWEIVHEDESVLVLHSTTTGNSIGAYFYTSITQIEKHGENRFVQSIISPMNSVQIITEGECIVVE